MNGTWVDGVKVGRGNLFFVVVHAMVFVFIDTFLGRQMLLNHCSLISLLLPECECFRYLDRAIMEAAFPFCLRKNYIVGEELGRGTTSVVRVGYKMLDEGKHEKFALKIVKLKEVNSKYSLPADNKVEVKIMTNLNHPGILKLIEVIEDQNIVIVMEYAAGGELFHLIKEDYEDKRLSEHLTKIQFYQIVHCVRYLHKNQVCHRDLKLENILLLTNSDMSPLKVADFGLSKSGSGFTDSLRSYVGTPVYMAPEISRLEENRSLEAPYTPKVDCWSLGVILYAMLSGKRPFSTGSDLNSRIMSGRYRPMVGPQWESISRNAKDLIKRLLEVDPEARWSTDQVLGHPWFVEDEGAVSLARSIMFGDDEDKENFKEE